MFNVSARQFFVEGSGIVTQCGSTRFFPENMKCNRELTFLNWMVLMCGSWGQSYHKEIEAGFTAKDYAEIKQLHFHKILESDAIVIVSDKSMYMGDSTREEKAFAESRNIPVFTFDGEMFSGWGVVDRIPNRLKDDSLITPWRNAYAKQQQQVGL